MKTKTRLAFSIMLANMAQTYGVESVKDEFAVTEPLAQELQDAISLQDDFLQRINVVGVPDLNGEKVLGSANGIVGKRTNVDAGDRQTSNLLNLGDKKYSLSFTEFDVHVLYKIVDTWSKFPDLADRYGRYVRKQIALGRVKVGWYGESTAAVATNLVANPNGQDVNTGWFQILRDYNGGAQMFDQGGTANQIRIGAGGDFENLDSIVHGVTQSLHQNYQNAGDLVAIVGRELLAEDKAQLYAAQGQTPTEKERLENNAVTKTYGGLPVAPIPANFPGRGLLVTSYDNLSLYYQESSVRRTLMENPKRNRVEDYNSLSEGYVIEDEEKASAIEFKNVVLPNGAGGWA